jgi:hypothetical protein
MPLQNCGAAKLALLGRGPIGGGDHGCVSLQCLRQSEALGGGAQDKRSCTVLLFGHWIESEKQAQNGSKT